MPDAHKNFAYSTVATAPSPASSGTSLVVAAADGTKFPAAPFNATIWPVGAQPTTVNAEIVRVTNVSTDTLTITRAQESTSARTVVIGDQIAATVTAKTLTDVEFDQYANTYLTVADETQPANTQVIYDDYFELAASFEYELSSGAVLVVGDFATPLPKPDQNPNIFVTVADETIPSNSEVLFSDFYELSAPFETEVAGGALLQLGTTPDLPGPFLPGYEIGYDQITGSVTISSNSSATPTTIITCAPHTFDGTPVFLDVLLASLTTPASINQVTISVFEYTTSIARLGFVSSSATAAMTTALRMGLRFTPTAGSHAYLITGFVQTSGSAIVSAAADAASYARFTKV